MGKAKRLKALRRVSKVLTVGKQERGYAGHISRTSTGAQAIHAIVPGDTTRGVYRRLKKNSR